MRRLRRTALWVSLFAWACAGGGCGGEDDTLAALAAHAASPGGGRAAAAVSIAKAFRDGHITFDAALTMAQERLEAVADTLEDVQAGSAATSFAGAVLDAIEDCSDRLADGGEFEIFWMRVGGLAFASAEVALAQQRVQDARSLVFAGGSRWQHENYWLRRPDHDGLASAVLARCGERDQAIRRLRERPELTGVADEVYRALTSGGP